MPPVKPVGLASKPAGRTSCYSAPFTSGAFLFWCSIMMVILNKQGDYHFSWEKFEHAIIILWKI